MITILWRLRFWMAAVTIILIGGLAIRGIVDWPTHAPLLWVVLFAVCIMTVGAFAAIVFYKLFAEWRAFQATTKQGVEALRMNVGSMRDEQAQIRKEQKSELSYLADQLERLQGQVENPKAPKKSVARNTEIVSLDTQDDIDTAEELLDRALKVLNARLGQGIGAERKRQLFSEQPGRPCVTIVVPLFNEERFVGATIKSLLDQDYTNFEAIVVDDGSTDRSMSAAKKAAGDDSRFVFARHAVNSGLSAARNTGLRLATAPLITFLDSDDLLFPDALSARILELQKLQKEKSDCVLERVVGVYCRAITMPESITVETAERRLRTREASIPIVDFVTSRGECPFNAHAPMLITDIVRAHGGFDETLKHGCEDWDLWQRILRNGYVFFPCNRIAAIYRRKRGSMVKATPQEHLETAKVLFDRARSTIDLSSVVSTAPYIYDKPLMHYQDATAFSSRLAQFTTINCFAGDAAFEETLEKFSKSESGAADVDQQYRAYVEAGIRRVIAIDEPAIEKFHDKFTDVCNGVIKALQQCTKRQDHTREMYSADRYDVIFFPQSQSQVKAMLAVLSSMEAETKCLFVTTETETGNQGQVSVLEGANVVATSYNRALLCGIEGSVFVVMRPYTALIRDMLPSQAAIIELEDKSQPVSVPDENMPFETELICTVEDFSETLRRVLKAASSPATINARPDTVKYREAPLVMEKEESFFRVPDVEKLSRMKDKWRGQRCVIIGNGPSINETDLTRLSKEKTFAVNGIFYKKDEMGFDPTFYVVEDSAVMKENIEAIKAYKGEYKLFPTLYQDLHPRDDNVAFFSMNRGFYEVESPAYCIPRFSVDAARRVYCGQSVTHINLQLAYYFGFSEVYLIGVDFSYVIPESAIRNGDLIVSTEDDPNHFHGDYFGKGKTWKDPKLHRVKLNYELARSMFEADGRKVFNATKGGKLEVFERADYDSIF